MTTDLFYQGIMRKAKYLVSLRNNFESTILGFYYRLIR